MPSARFASRRIAGGMRPPLIDKIDRTADFDRKDFFKPRKFETSAPSNGSEQPSALGAEHPLEDRVDMAEVIAEVEALLELVGRQQRRHLGVRLEQVEERDAAVRLPDLHRVALDQAVRVLAAGAGLGQG